MRKEIVEYKKNFGKEPWISNIIKCEYEKWLNNLGGHEKAREIFEMDNTDYGNFKCR